MHRQLEVVADRQSGVPLVEAPLETWTPPELPVEAAPLETWMAPLLPVEASPLTM